MRIHKPALLIACIITLLACNSKNSKLTITPSNEAEITTEAAPLSKAQILLDRVVKAHGGDLYNSAYYSFVFRGNTYHFKNDGPNYEYAKNTKDGNSVTKDLLVNGAFSRTLDGDPVTLSGKKLKSAAEALNSVIYFVTLPHKLQDAAVQKTYLGVTSIKGEHYAILGITFDREGGGEDFDDAYHYWIHTETNKIDYLAYNFNVDKGGVRFRSAYNRSVVDGITFQDYINYKAERDTPLLDLPLLYEAGELQELSKIETEHIRSLK
ncbi:MAG: hypothetical protein K8F54_01055 [Altibacter sp.]|uniref:DUF6503 family protein n=1 Tax=Altibacter sp. TaxID=2024823 RepID=UPI001DBAE5CA|nr:DUF6503 family protein [Altibacter sp.]MBZ0326166.1 hypothetical protein [Altibacter sp.]